MNENFENFKSIACDAAQTAARKAKLVAFLAKTNLSILAEQDKLKKLYTELGKLYYRDFLTDEEPDEAEYLPLCDKVSASVKVISDLKADIERAKQEDADLSASKEQAQDAPCDEAFEEEPAEKPEKAEQPEEPEKPEE